MMKNVTKFIFLFGLLLAPVLSFAQDVIFKTTGEEIKAKILEIEDLKIKYRKFDNLEGPIYNIAKSEVLLIKYQNGSIEVYKKEEEAPKQATAPEPAPAPTQIAVPAPAPASTIQRMTEAPRTTSPTTPSPVYSTGSSGRTGRFYLAYSPGDFAPIGISMGAISDGGGLIFSARLSGSALGEVSIYEMSDAEGMSDDYWNWKYTGESEYRRGAFTLAYASKLAGNIDKTSLHGYVGLGYGFANYFYIYEQLGQSGTSYGNEYVKYTDVSKSSVEVEAGLILDLNGFNLNVGYTTCGFAEPMMTFGIGLGL